MVEEKNFITMRRLKLLLWAFSSGIIVAFFFASNILDFATGFSPGGDILFISPLFCGFTLGLLTTKEDVYHSVILSIIMTITAVILISMALLSPVIFGVSGGVVDNYYIFVVQQILVAIVLIFPVALGSAVMGKVFGEATLLSSIYKRERTLLRKETLEWYEMLEAAVDREKKLKEIEESEGRQSESEYLSPETNEEVEEVSEVVEEPEEVAEPVVEDFEQTE